MPKKLTKILISPLNDQFIFKDNKYLLGKTNSNSDEFDILLFASYEIDFLQILMLLDLIHLEIHLLKKFLFHQVYSKICENAFYSCFRLEKVEILKNSNL